MLKVKFLVKNKCLTGYGVKNLTEFSHNNNYGLYGVVKNQILTGIGVITNDVLYITWDIGGCTMLRYDLAKELGFEFE